MNIKKSYYSLKEKEFTQYLKRVKDDPETINIFKDMKKSYFYYPDSTINNLLLKLHSLQMEFDSLISALSIAQKDMIKQSFLIDEVQSTNKTENIYSTKNDIFGITSNKQTIKNKKIVSIVNSYLSIGTIKESSLKSFTSLRKLYDNMMKDAYEKKNDSPDGKIFRKGIVYVTDGLKPVHQGFYPESNINKGMNDYIKIISDDDIDIYLKILISHFIIETVHPFYDGNGRYGRYLMSISLFNNTNSLLSYALSSSINKEKKKYYKALDVARDYHEFGCINEYIIMMLNILINYYKYTIKDITDKLLLISNNKKYPLEFTKSEKKIYDLLLNATYLTYFGINNEEIMKYTGISKKTVITCFNKLYDNDLITDYKLGKVNFHKLNFIIK